MSDLFGGDSRARAEKGLRQDIRDAVDLEVGALGEAQDIIKEIGQEQFDVLKDNITAAIERLQAGDASAIQALEQSFPRARGIIEQTTTG